MTPGYVFIVPMILGMALAFVASALFVTLIKWLDGKEARRRFAEDRKKMLHDLRLARDDAASVRKQLRPLQNACESARYHIQSVPKRYGNPDDSAILNELDAVLSHRTERTAAEYIRQQPTSNDWDNLRSEMKRTMQGAEHEPA